MPSVIILAGCNGVGKTTASETVLVESLKLFTFVNADTIAKGLSAYNPEASAMEAGRIMLERLNELANQKKDFAFETTLSGRGYVRWFRDWHTAGYYLHLVYIWLNDVNLAVQRVAQRVREGGHNIPEDRIRERYERSVRNFFQLYEPLVDSWDVFENSLAFQPELIARKLPDSELEIHHNSNWDKFKEMGSK